MSIEETIQQLACETKNASRQVAALSTEQKDAVLTAMAEGLRADKAFIQAENEKDLSVGLEKGLSSAMLDRLTLSDAVIDGMIQGIDEIIALADPVGEISDMKRRPSGITVGRMRIPLGVIGMIYESRPNVTVDAAALCLKAGNAVLLRGGSEAIHSNVALAKTLQAALEKEGVAAAAVQVVPVTDRSAVNALLECEDEIDLIIPRGGEGLIRFVVQNSRIPVLKHYKGVCHIFVDRDADCATAQEIILNSKAQRPGVCNALETLLVHRDVAEQFLPEMATRLHGAGVELHCCPESMKYVADAEAATEEDWGMEYLELILAVKIVDDMDAAMAHIVQYGSQHTESILTSNYANAQRFLREVDASSVMVNASTRFSDGGQYGLGAEIGISTSKLHAYGPMGLKELTTKKFIVYGDGQIRS